MKKIIISLCIGFICVFFINSHFEKKETALAQSLIRLHVIANSDSGDDQSLKLKVRDRVIKECGDIFSENETIDTAREDILANLGKIENCAIDEVRKNGYSYDVNVVFAPSYFPTKEYGDLVLPTGSYEAVRVEIGKASGQNWWCVLFPPLCFVDQTCVTVSGDAIDKISSASDDLDKEFISTEKDGSVEFKFKTYELWQKSKQKISTVMNKIKSQSKI